MKYSSLIIVFLLSFNLSAQQHEVKLDVLDLVAFKTLDITYQFNLNEESSVGISLYTPLSDNEYVFDNDIKESFRLTPYYRHYFQLGYAGNFFADAFLSINSGTLFLQDISEMKYTDGAFGFNIGKAYISPRGFVLEALVGGGRNLFESEGSPNFIANFAINLGYRF
ncbi:MAG: DUF3575 domain-containing protein [Flavobacteriaceae bacterium]